MKDSKISNNFSFVEETVADTRLNFTGLTEDIQKSAKDHYQGSKEPLI